MAQQFVDPATGRRYFVDPTTGQSRWVEESAVQSPAAGFVPGPAAFQQALHHEAAPVALRSPMASQAPYAGYAVGQPTVGQSRLFVFDGGAGSYLGVVLVSVLVTIVSLGLLLPWAVVMQYRWRTEHTLLNGRRLRFTGRAIELFGEWIIMWLLCLVTLGIYSFWVVPRLTRWAVENQELG